jgi:hypothetical protein
MSDQLYLTRLRWSNGAGIAKSCGRRVVLTAPPALGFPFYSLDFSPGVCEQIRSEPWSELRELFADERAACLAYLDDLVEPPDLAGDGQG